MTKAKHFIVHDWVENEIQSNIDSYKNTRAQAMRHVRDMLEEGEYGDELTWKQILKAKLEVQSLPYPPDVCAEFKAQVWEADDTTIVAGDYLCARLWQLGVYYEPECVLRQSRVGSSVTTGVSAYERVK